MKENPIAILTLRNIAKLPRNQKKQLINWLKRQAQSLQDNGHNYTDLFRARHY